MFGRAHEVRVEMNQQYTHQWDLIRAEDPEHSARYAKRWRDLAANGMDLDGEARMVSALVPPGARILDAGCGTGRVGGYLAAHGYQVAGVDLDDYLIEQAKQDHPEGEWHVGDLASFDLSGIKVISGSGEDAGFDAIVCAGNVLTFLDPRSRRPALTNLGRALASGGRLVTGFGAERGYAFADYEDDLRSAGLEIQQRYSTWNLHSYSQDSDFLVCISGPAAHARARNASPE